MAPVAGNIIRVAARQKFQAVNDIVNVFHLSVVTVPSGANDTDFMTDVATYLSNAYAGIAGFISNAQDTEDLLFFNVTQNYPMGFRNWGPGYSGGTASGEMLPTQVAALVAWPTFVKRVQGHTYHGVLSEASQQDSMLTAAAYAGFVAWADDMRDSGVGALGYRVALGVYRRSAGALVIPSTFVVRMVLATQRRRKLGVGS